jgi:hypothetical protein
VSDTYDSERVERRADEIRAARPWLTSLEALQDAQFEIRMEDMPPLTQERAMTRVRRLLWSAAAIVFVLAGIAAGAYVSVLSGWDGDIPGGSGDWTNTPILPGIAVLPFWGAAWWCWQRGGGE